MRQQIAFNEGLAGTIQPVLFDKPGRHPGQIGGRSQLKREQYLLQEEATTAFEKARDAHVKRGFQVTFVRGAEPPKP